MIRVVELAVFGCGLRMVDSRNRRRIGTRYRKTRQEINVLRPRLGRDPRRLALMNLYLHGLEPEIVLGDAIYEARSGRRFDVILTNPPFGTRGANQAPDRDDFTIRDSKQAT